MIFRFCIFILILSFVMVSGQSVSTDRQTIKVLPPESIKSDKEDATQQPATGEEKQKREQDTKELQEVFAALFRAYEEESIQDFMQHIHENFLSLDFSGNRLNYTQIRRSAQDDFKILDGIRHQIFVNNIFVQKDGLRAKISFRWSRRAIIVSTNEEWKIQNQTSDFIFEKGSWRLSKIEGAPVFGLADPAGNITIKEGTIAGNKVEAPVVVGVIPSAGGSGSTNKKIIELTSSTYTAGQKVNLKTSKVSVFTDRANIVPGEEVGFLKSSQPGESSITSGYSWEIVTPADIGKIFTSLGGPLAYPIKILGHRPDDSPAWVKIEIMK